MVIVERREGRISPALETAVSNVFAQVKRLLRLLLLRLVRLRRQRLDGSCGRADSNDRQSRKVEQQHVLSSTRDLAHRQR